MKKNILIPLLSTIILFAACKKVSPAKPQGGVPTPTYYFKLNPAALEFVQIPVNRHFVYKDSATGNKDTVRVTQSIVEKKLQLIGFATLTCACSNTPEYYYETFTLNLTKISGTVNQNWFYGVASSDKGYPQYGPPAQDTSFGIDGSEGTAAFWYPFTPSSGDLGYSFIPIMIIAGNSYSDVRKFTAKNYWQPSDPHYIKTIFYWVKGIGIIKKEITAGNSFHSYELIKYW